jgi:hypothetical protein
MVGLDPGPDLDSDQQTLVVDPDPAKMIPGTERICSDPDPQH